MTVEQLIREDIVKLIRRVQGGDPPSMFGDAEMILLKLVGIVPVGYQDAWV